MKKTSPGNNVLAVYSLADKAGRDIFAGMLDAMSDKSDWHLYTSGPSASFSERDMDSRGNLRYDGFIITMPGTPKAMHALAKASQPTVLVNITDRGLSRRTDAISFVWIDNEDIGRRGAEHLLERGLYKSAGYVHELRYEFYSYEREVAFRTAMKRRHVDTTSFPQDNDFTNFQTRLRHWLRTLPKPAAIMAVSDMRAADVINACRDEGISVPGQVAVVGVDNDLWQHKRCGMAISSVLPDLRRMGRIAAQELDFLFRHPRHKGKPHEHLVPVRGVIARESSARSLPAAKLVRKALDFIDANREVAIGRNDVAKHLGCSLQLAELRFRQVIGATIRATIEKTRLEEVARRLRGREVTVSRLAQDLHFSSARQLSRAFKRHFGFPISAST